MKDTKSIVSHIGRAFQIACFLLSIYYTLLFCIQYGENADSNLTVVKKFNIETKDKYPTVSLCFSGNNFHWFNINHLKLFESYGLSLLQFENMLKGQPTFRYEKNHSLQLYKKIPTLVNDVDLSNFDQLHVKVTDFIKEIKYSYENLEHNDYYPNDQGVAASPESLIKLSYQTPDTICFTRKDEDPLNSIRLHDLITVKTSLLSETRYKDTKFNIFIHYPGQLIRSLDWPVFTTSFNSLGTLLGAAMSNLRRYVLEFKIFGIKTLRKRSDSNTPCKHDTISDDRYLQQQFVKELGCIPIYWKHFFTMEHNLKVCDQQEELKNAYGNISKVRNILKWNTPPCNEMVLQTADFINRRPVIAPKDGAIAFYYSNKMFEEINYSKAVEFQNWLSNVGGFVGIFLGYSLMQMPELFICIIELNIRRKYRLLKGKSVFIQIEQIIEGK